MLDYTWAKIHAALNDLPAAFLLAAVLFDLAGWALKRETLRAVGMWTLWAGVVGGWLAYVAGQMAEDSIDHGQRIHELMERHEDLALYVMVLFTAILAWKLWRRARLSPVEDLVVRLFGLAGLVLLFVTAAVGGQAVFDHAAGVTNDAMMDELQDRGVEMPAAAGGDSMPASEHQHAPGTPPHEH
jgi:uncharacterized membrane protein